MNIKKTITILSVFLLLGCGYEPIHSKKKINDNYNFTINRISFGGENKVNQIIKHKLKKYSNLENKIKNFNLDLNSKIVKKISAKNKKGNPIRFSMEIIIDLEVLENKTFKAKTNFTESFEYNNKSNKFDLKKYEKNIQNNLTSKLSNNIIKYLNNIK